ncbi:MAG: carbamoyl-phosphate synthase large subunit, partial [Dehalococcoidia bacterium]|nr:carbamoyl-phosphate synthase large subunit [Dehalococcoidia bacterium]
RGYAIQARVNMETIGKDGTPHPASGTLALYQPPGGPGIRTDGFGYSGYRTNTLYDSLLAKVIAHTSADDFPAAARRLSRALGEFQVAGLDTNIPFLRAILDHEDFGAARITTRWVDEHVAELAEAVASVQSSAPGAETDRDGFAGARVDSRDP